MDAGLMSIRERLWDVLGCGSEGQPMVSPETG